MVEEAGGLKRSLPEMQTRTNTITAEYSHKFCRINDRRVETFLNQLRTDCYKKYSGTMKNEFDITNTYFEETDLQEIHKTAKDESLALVCLLFAHFIT